MGKDLACILGLVLVLAAPAITAGPPRPPGGAGAPTSRVLDLRVVERDGETPVAGVAIVSLPGRKNEPAFRGATDEQGRCSVPVPSDIEKTRHFAVRAWKDGFVPVRVLWGYTRSFEFERVPASYTVILDRGTTIGGTVRDEQGRPIAGLASSRKSSVAGEAKWNGWICRRTRASRPTPRDVGGARRCRHPGIPAGCLSTSSIPISLAQAHIVGTGSCPSRTSGPRRR